jgi:flagellin-like protein
MRRIKKRGVSPVVATVLLIAIVIILAIIIFIWARGFIAEKAQKFGRAIELSCEDINFEAGVFCGAGCDLDIVNRGDIPLYGFEIKELATGSLIVKETVTGTVTLGDSTSITLPSNVAEYSGKSYLVVPVILGETDSGKVAFTCPDTVGIVTGVV